MEEPKSKAKRGAKTAAAAQEDKITLLPLSELHDFPNHPFKVRDDEAMQETTESIRQYGVLVPAIVRPREGGGYEIIAEAFYGVPEELKHECRQRLTPKLAEILRRWERALYNEKICDRI